MDSCFSIPMHFLKQFAIFWSEFSAIDALLT
jgi:hypothetical protein